MIQVARIIGTEITTIGLIGLFLSRYITLKIINL